MEPKQFLNYNITDVIGCRETKGDKFGVELELEGRGVGLADVATRGWNRHNDGSLRGEAIEYAMAGAKGFDESKKLVIELFKKLTDNKVKFNDSIRTSTHVHLNFSDRPVKYMVNFFTLFTMLEEVLQYYSGEDRKGNLFCISTREGEGIVGVLVSAIEKGSLAAFAGDRYKYGACNLSSLFKFGTVEVRTMKGASSALQVNAWLDILNDMYVYACGNMKSPAELIKDFSFLGAEGLLKKIFKSDNFRELMLYFPKVQTLHYSLMEGARILQVFAYSFEEDFIAKVELPKVDVKEGHGVHLPKRMPDGRGMYAIYKPNGGLWNVSGKLHGEFWQHGEQVADDPRITWDAVQGRFVFRDRADRLIPCRWARHEIFGNEGPPPRNAPAIEPEEEPDWEPDFDEEGDDF